MQSIVNIAFLTGGESSRFDFARNALDKIDRTTLTGYLIGYYPSNPSRDGRYRKLDVRVNRRGATALFRHGYDATDEPAVDRRTLLTLRRVSADWRPSGGCRRPQPASGRKLGKDARRQH